MLALEWIAERRIEEAVARGELENLPNAGRPLDLYEDPLVPEEMRMAKRILKNADVSPEDLRIGVRARYFAERKIGL